MKKTTMADIVKELSDKGYLEKNQDVSKPQTDAAEWLLDADNTVKVDITKCSSAIINTVFNQLNAQEKQFVKAS